MRQRRCGRAAQMARSRASEHATEGYKSAKAPRARNCRCRIATASGLVYKPAYKGYSLVALALVLHFSPITALAEAVRTTRGAEVR